MTTPEQPLRLLRLSPYNFCADLLEEFMGADEIIYAADRPDIIEIKVNGPHPLSGYCDLWAKLTETRRRYGFAPLLVAMSGENVPLPVAGLDYAFSTFAPTSERHLHYHWEVGVSVSGFVPSLMEPDSAAARELSAARAKRKTKFCNYVYSNDLTPTTQTRRDFCRLLSAYKRVDCAGKSLNNTAALRALDRKYGRSDRERAHGASPVSPKLEFLSDYKFTIAFEHTSADGYFTEKALMPLAVGSVPIYWGAPQIGEYINPRSFINAHDYDSFEALVAHVKRVDGDPELYEKYRSAPPLLPSSRFYAMKRDLPAFLERIRAEARRRRAARSPDGFLNWRRYYRVGAMVYANRARDPGYKRRIATAALPPDAKRRISRRTAPARRKLGLK